MGPKAKDVYHIEDDSRHACGTITPPPRHCAHTRAGAHPACLQHLLTAPEWANTAMWALTSYVFMLRYCLFGWTRRWQSCSRALAKVTF